MKQMLALFIAAGALFIFPTFAVADDDSEHEFSHQLKDLAVGRIYEIGASEILLEAITNANNLMKEYDQVKIDALNHQWHEEIGIDDQPLIQKVLSTKASKFLKQVQTDSDGLFTEIFTSGNNGVNVSQSEITSDYWHGDEFHWLTSFKGGAQAIFIGEIKIDDSTQILQSYISIPIIDDWGKPIGVITFGVDVQAL